ncbi:MAG: branched-chain amino acid transport system permease protein [Candidatus Promineifilaceae bacterium]|jgi:branched-chain amino acid transport system permease protein
MAALRPAGDYDESYIRDMSILRRPWMNYLSWTVVLLIFLLPFLEIWGYVPDASFARYTWWMNILNRIAYTIIALQGLNILTGFTGQISLGQAAFMLVGGYFSGLSMTYLGLPVIFTIPLAGLGTGLFGLLFGLPSLRVKGFYLAMATLAAQFIIPWMSRNLFKDYLGGTAGSIVVPIPTLFGFEFRGSTRMFLVSFVVLILTTLICNNIVRTKLGRAFVSVRDNDLAAELLGVNLYSYKLKAFFLAAAFAGIAGALRAHTERGIGTEFNYTLDISVLFLGMMVIGGLGTTLGPFFGAIFVILLDEGSLYLGEVIAHAFPDQAGALQTSFRPIVFGVTLIAFLIFEPRGLAHRWELLKATWRLRPFAR